MDSTILLDPIESDAFSDCICPICRSLAKTVHQAGCCGTLFCKSCIEGWKTTRRDSRHFTCPMCRGELHDNCFEDKNATRRINKIMVYCPNRSTCGTAGNNEQRCRWTGELKSVDDHLKFCDYQVVHCPNDGCSTKTERRNLSNHLKHDCACRKVCCRYCLKKIKLLDYKAHNKSECSELFVKCPHQGCNLVVKRRQLKHHITSSCLYRIIVCSADCGGVVPFIEQEDHLANTCMKRIVWCKYCNEEGEFSHISGAHYDSFCTRVPVPCPNDGCREKVKRGFKAEHIAVCLKQRVSCKYVEICDAEMLRENERLHYEWGREEHLTSAYSKMIDLQEECNEMADFVDEIRSKAKKNLDRKILQMNEEHETEVMVLKKNSKKYELRLKKDYQSKVNVLENECHKLAEDKRKTKEMALVGNKKYESELRYLESKMNGLKKQYHKLAEEKRETEEMAFVEIEKYKSKLRYLKNNYESEIKNLKKCYRSAKHNSREHQLNSCCVIA